MSHQGAKLRDLLIVGPNESLRSSLSAYLSDHAYQVVSASTAAEAFELMQARALPAAVIVHSILPDMSTGEFRTRLLEQPPLNQLPVIAIFAEADRALANFNHSTILFHPLDPGALLVAVKKLTSQRSRLLVVEDDRGVGSFLSVALGQMGFDVLLATSGREAVALLESQPDSIHGAMIDVQMADLDGPATMQALQEINPRLPCCFMSGHTGRYSHDDLLAMGARHLFSKPFVNLNELGAKLWQMIAPVD